MAARTLVICSAIFSSIIYWGLLAALRAQGHAQALALGLIVVPIAAIPSLPFTLIAYRLPKVLKLRCRKCGWSDRFVVDAGRRAQRARLGQCIYCGYDLAGNISGICPECGATTGA